MTQLLAAPQQPPSPILGGKVKIFQDALTAQNQKSPFSTANTKKINIPTTSSEKLTIGTFLLSLGLDWSKISEKNTAEIKGDVLTITKEKETLTITPDGNKKFDDANATFTIVNSATPPATTPATPANKDAVKNAIEEFLKNTT